MLIYEYAYMRIFIYVYMLIYKYAYIRIFEYDFNLQLAQIPSLSHCQAWAIAKPEPLPSLSHCQAWAWYIGESCVWFIAGLDPLSVGYRRQKTRAINAGKLPSVGFCLVIESGFSGCSEFDVIPTQTRDEKARAAWVSIGERWKRGQYCKRV